MEENKTTTENSKPDSKPSYEQLEQIALQLRQRLMQSEASLGAINLTTMRLNYLFSVLDRASHFPEKFVKDSAAEIVELLEVEEPEMDESNTLKFHEE